MKQLMQCHSFSWFAEDFVLASHGIVFLANSINRPLHSRYQSFDPSLADTSEQSGFPPPRQGFRSRFGSLSRPLHTLSDPKATEPRRERDFLRSHEADLARLVQGATKAPFLGVKRRSCASKKERGFSNPRRSPSGGACAAIRRGNPTATGHVAVRCARARRFAFFVRIRASAIGYWPRRYPSHAQTILHFQTQLDQGRLLLRAPPRGAGDGIGRNGLRIRPRDSRTHDQPTGAGALGLLQIFCPSPLSFPALQNRMLA